MIVGQRICNFFLYLASAVFSGAITAAFKRKKKSLLLIVAYAAITLCLFLVAGEEISWGQRLLGLETPEQIAASNTQGEFNLHNHEVIFGYVYRAYVYLTAYCSFAWVVNYFRKILLSKFNHELNWSQYFVPPVYLMSFFFTSFIMFYLYRVQNIPLGELEEYSELMLAAGLVIFFGNNLLQVKDIKASDWA